MLKQRTVRGFALLEKKQVGNYNLKLLFQNNERYLVLIHRYMWGVRIFNKTFVYHDEERARLMFEKLAYGKLTYQRLITSIVA